MGPISKISKTENLKKKGRKKETNKQTNFEHLVWPEETHLEIGCSQWTGIAVSDPGLQADTTMYVGEQSMTVMVMVICSHFNELVRISEFCVGDNIF